MLLVVDSLYCYNTSQMKLHSLYRYQPRLHIVQLPSSQLNEGDAIKGCGLSTHVFAETRFVAVTAYQNDKVLYYEKWISNLFSFIFSYYPVVEASKLQLQVEFV